jgi:hypothetical protein
VLLLALATAVALTPAAQVETLAAVRRRTLARDRPMIGLKPLLPADVARFPMCGIVGVISKAPVNQLIYDALLLLQHRGQDAAGIVTMQGTRCFMHKARGMVRDVFRTRNMRGLPGLSAWARCATRRPATPTARKRRSPSTSTRPSASCWCTTAT